ncbi:MAG: metallophosphoesterase family protein [Candidatus Omnitrophica bacterium]|nr:metallophosphoesterase family protein [Candidatus Omnitrophota bacterium]
MIRILVLADTHIPVAARDIPSQIYREIDKVDLILHAGDIVEEVFLKKLSSLKEVKTVRGNMDSIILQKTLSEKSIINIGKFKIGLVHGSGSSANILDRIRNGLEGTDVIVFGHTHNSLNLVKEDVLFFNPGSPTDRVFAIFNSYGILEIDEEIKGEIIRL